MSKRESGWYRVWVRDGENPKLTRYFAHDFTWIERSIYDGSVMEVGDNFYHKIDPQMVMTPEGQIVYNQPAHDPLYNTKQEG